MEIDLLYAIASNYRLLPDERLSCLTRLAALHVSKMQHAEAAQCYLHASALVAEYLAMLNELPKQLLSGCAVFDEISPNVLEESAVSDDVARPDEVVRSGIEGGEINQTDRCFSTF